MSDSSPLLLSVFQNTLMSHRSYHLSKHIKVQRALHNAAHVRNKIQWFHPISHINIYKKKEQYGTQYYSYKVQYIKSLSNSGFTKHSVYFSPNMLPHMVGTFTVPLGRMASI